MPKRVKTPYAVVRNSRIHGKGMFATRDIEEGTRVIEYVGEKITKAESDRRADIPLARHAKDRTKGAVYIFTLNKRHDIDGDVWWNTAKNINHSCEPNCETDIIRGKIWIIALRDIKKGEELVYNYGYDIDDYEDHPCVCLAEKCVGYILSEDLWSRLRKRLKTKKKKARKTNGSNGHKRPLSKTTRNGKRKTKRTFPVGRR